MWLPPTEGCDRVALLHGKGTYARLYYTAGSLRPCLHLLHEASSAAAQGGSADREEVVVDLDACTTSSTVR